MVGSKPFTSPAIRTGNSLGSKAWMKSMPLSPATAARHVDGASRPIGVIAPKSGDGDPSHRAILVTS